MAFFGLGVQDQDIVKFSKFGNEDHSRYLSSNGIALGGTVKVGSKDTCINQGSWVYCHDSTAQNDADNWKAFQVAGATNAFMFRKCVGAHDMGRYLNSYGCGKREGHSFWAMCDERGLNSGWQLVAVPDDERNRTYEGLYSQRNVWKLRKHSGVDAGKFLCCKGETHKGKRDNKSSWAFVTSSQNVHIDEGQWLITVVTRVAAKPTTGPTPAETAAAVVEEKVCKGCHLEDEVWDGTPLNLEQLYDIKEKFTTSAWVKVSANPGWGRILCKSSAIEKGWQFRVRAGMIEFAAAGKQLELSGKPYICDGAWHHVVVVCLEGKKFKGYVDGKSNMAGYKVSTGVTPDPDADLWLGGKEDDKFAGELTCIQVFNYALTEKEMKELLKVPALVKAERDAQAAEKKAKAEKYAEEKKKKDAEKKAADKKKNQDRQAKHKEEKRKEEQRRQFKDKTRMLIQCKSKAPTPESAEEEACKRFEIKMSDWIEGNCLPPSVAEPFKKKIPEAVAQVQKADTKKPTTVHYVTNQEDFTLLTVMLVLKSKPVASMCMCLQKNKFEADVTGIVNFVQAANAESFDHAKSMQNADKIRKFDEEMKKIQLLQETE